MQNKELQFIDWLCGKSDRFPFFKDEPEIPEVKMEQGLFREEQTLPDGTKIQVPIGQEVEYVRCVKCGRFYPADEILPNGMDEGCWNESK